MTPELAAALAATWPAAAVHQAGPWLLRNGAGGGKRVSAASVVAAWTVPDIAVAETGMAALGQPALFMIGEDDAALDAVLAAKGYRMVDPVVIYAAPIAALTATLPALTCFPHWPPLAITRDLWVGGGIGSARLAVMARVAGPKAAILARRGDRVAAVTFVACDGAVAVIHALEVAPAMRRSGVGRTILHGAANWASGLGAETLALAVTAANTPARTLYTSLGMQGVGHYHYRQL